MGQESSLISEASRLYEMPLRQYSLKQKLNEAVSIWRRRNSPFDELLEHRMVVNTEKQLQRVFDIFKMRHMHTYLPATRYLTCQAQGIQGCGGYFKGLIYVEASITTLSMINDIPFLDSLHIYNVALKGFEIMYNKFGYFDVLEDMFHICQNGKLKVWCNSSVYRLEPEPYMLDASGKQEDMLFKIINIIDDNTDKGQKFNMRKQIYRRLPPTGHLRSFDQAIKMFRHICKQNDWQPPQRLKCVAQLTREDMDRLLQQQSEMNAVREYHLYEDRLNNNNIGQTQQINNVSKQQQNEGKNSLQIYSAKPERFNVYEQSEINFVEIDKKSTERANLASPPKNPAFQQLDTILNDPITLRPPTHFHNPNQNQAIRPSSPLPLRPLVAHSPPQPIPPAVNPIRFAIPPINYASPIKKIEHMMQVQPPKPQPTLIAAPQNRIISISPRRQVNFRPQSQSPQFQQNGLRVFSSPTKPFYPPSLGQQVPRQAPTLHNTVPNARQMPIAGNIPVHHQIVKQYLGPPRQSNRPTTTISINFSQPNPNSIVTTKKSENIIRQEKMLKNQEHQGHTAKSIIISDLYDPNRTDDRAQHNHYQNHENFSTLESEVHSIRRPQVAGNSVQMEKPLRQRAQYQKFNQINAVSQENSAKGTPRAYKPFDYIKQQETRQQLSSRPNPPKSRAEYTDPQLIEMLSSDSKSNITINPTFNFMLSHHEGSSSPRVLKNGQPDQLFYSFSKNLKKNQKEAAQNESLVDTLLKYSQNQESRGNSSSKKYEVAIDGEIWKDLVELRKAKKIH